MISSTDRRYWIPGWILILIGVGVHVFGIFSGGRDCGPALAVSSVTVTLSGLLVSVGAIAGLFFPRLLRFVRERKK